MKKAAFDKAVSEAKRFLDCASKAKPYKWKDIYGKQHHEIQGGNKESGAIRRASLDLTRALAEMRKS